ncbi:hypothetical protein G3M83_09290 [Rouxiella badensis]|uniref:hypothetical protein n=1 Tax=Rouxiella badensis TaxID=1646377 RepID=UPI0013EF0BC6|nr:hypothetical protein [Rouxiella badensis]QII37878.1 hypothetical protein G3M83_09290 [Rouxiella badensis]
MMNYDNISTYYFDSSSNARLVRYDVVKINEDKIIVKAFDQQQKDIAPPNVVVEVGNLVITKEQYSKDYGLGGRQTSIRDRMAPSFGGYVLEKCQEHRNLLDN